MMTKHGAGFLEKIAPLGRTLCIGGKPGAGASLKTDPLKKLNNLGATSVVTLDISTNCDISHNLNSRFNRSIGVFKTLYDPGTVEHIANIGEALETYHKVLAVGGSMVIETVTDGHQTHGFYQINPQLFMSVFSGLNGYSTEVWSYRIGPLARLHRELWQDKQSMRVQLPTNIIVLARKTKSVERLEWPVQPVWRKQHTSPRFWRLKMIMEMTSFFCKRLY